MLNTTMTTGAMCWQPLWQVVLCDVAANNFCFVHPQPSTALILGQAMRLWKEFNDLFSIFPFSALIKNKILCMHGGLSPHLESLNDIRNVNDMLHFPSNDLIKKQSMI